MKGKKARTLLLDALCMLAGSAVYAVEVNAFTAPNNIAAGGITGAFPHEHHLGLGVAHAEHHVVARLAQGALLAGQAGFFQLVPMAYHTRFSSQLFPYCSTWAASMQIPIEISPLW